MTLMPKPDINSHPPFTLNNHTVYVGRHQINVPIIRAYLSPSLCQKHILSMELDLQSLFGLPPCIQLYSILIGRGPATPPPHLGLYTRALLVNRRHLFVTTWSEGTVTLSVFSVFTLSEKEQFLTILCHFTHCPSYVFLHCS